MATTRVATTCVGTGALARLGLRRDSRPRLSKPSAARQLQAATLDYGNNKKAPAPSTREGVWLSGFCLVINPDSFYAAISRYSSGRSSNSFLHSSEQKKYFLPANWVRNSDSLSSTLIPHTGSVVMIPPVGEFVSFLTAMTFPFSAFPQVIDPVHLSRLTISCV